MKIAIKKTGLLLVLATAFLLLGSCDFFGLTPTAEEVNRVLSSAMIDVNAEVDRALSRAAVSSEIFISNNYGGSATYDATYDTVTDDYSGTIEFRNYVVRDDEGSYYTLDGSISLDFSATVSGFQSDLYGFLSISRDEGFAGAYDIDITHTINTSLFPMVTISTAGFINSTYLNKTETYTFY
jgi:hypothetical protein